MEGDDSDSRAHGCTLRRVCRDRQFVWSMGVPFRQRVLRGPPALLCEADPLARWVVTSRPSATVVPALIDSSAPQIAR